MDSIHAENLTKLFGPRKAVKGITFSVGSGEIFGFLGPNGAGKSTTINMLTGQLQPTSGSAKLLGMDVVTQNKQVKPLYGIVFEYPNLYERLTVRANLVFSADLYGVGHGEVDEILMRVGLLDRAGDYVRRLSNGMRQRLLIARAIVHQPKVLFLDEPTRGLDPGIAHDIRKLITELSEMGMTIFLTTHYMEEADQLCRRVAILNEGVIIALDTPANLKATYDSSVVKVALDDGRIQRFDTGNPADFRQYEHLKASGQQFTIQHEDSTLEQVFMRLTGRSLNQ